MPELQGWSVSILCSVRGFNPWLLDRDGGQPARLREAEALAFTEQRERSPADCVERPVVTLDHGQTVRGLLEERHYGECGGHTRQDDLVLGRPLHPGDDKLVLVVR